MSETNDRAAKDATAYDRALQHLKTDDLSRMALGKLRESGTASNSAQQAQAYAILASTDALLSISEQLKHIVHALELLVDRR